MSQTQTINTPQDYVNYTFNIEARGIAEVSSELMGLSNTVGNILGQIAFKTSEFLSHTDMLAIGTGTAVSAMFVSATKDAIHFQQQIANVQAIGGEAINAQDIGNAAMEFSNKFGMATSSMTEGLEALARAGITSTSVMKEVLAEGVKLSKLEGLDLEDSINDLISTTNLLSQEGVDMNDPNYGQMVQAMNQHIVSTSESAPINAQNIIQSLQHVGGYASASGMDQDDLFAVIAQLGSRGTKGEMAGTALRAFIAAGQKDTAQRALARIGLNVSDLWNNNGETMLSISEMKDVLDEALEARGYSKQEKLEFYSDFAGYKQANQIMKIDTSEVQQYKESIANAWDLGKKLDVILGTVRGNLDRIWQTTQNFMTKVGSNLLNVMSAILTPVRIFLDIITKIPFADKAVAAGMIFIAFRTGLMIFNKLVPAIGGFMSGLNKAKDGTRGFRGEWQKTREEVEKTRDIISMLRGGDQEGLAKIHYEEHGLSAKNKASAERDIAGQMYMKSSLYEATGRTRWDQLPDYTQDMFLERIKATDQFKQNYNTLVDRTKELVSDAVSDPIIIDDFAGQDTLEAINTWVELIFDLLNSDRTRGQSDHSQDNDEGSQDNRRRNAQARTLSSIFENRVRGNTYGNVNFKYERSEEGYAEAKAGLKAAYDDLRKYTRALSNTDSDNINPIQRNAYKKLFTTRVSEEGQEATKRANESEIRLIFEKGQLESHENDYEGIKDSQVEYIAKKLNLDDFRIHDYKNNDRRAEFAQAAHEAIQNISEDRRQAVIDEIINGTGDNRDTKGTNKLWEESLDKIAIGRKNFLLSKPEIANSIISQISNINTQGYNSNTEAVLDYFKGLDDSHTDWDIAIKTAMEVLKGDSDYSKIEENTIKYIADNIQRHKETILSYQADAETLGFSEGVKNEIEDVLNDMRNDEALLRQGGSLLGEAIVNGFIGDGLGRHSPGYMFWALVDEQTDINKAILQSRGLLNKNAGLLGLELTNAFDSSLGIDRVFDSGIEFIRRDTDVIKDIIANFDKDEFRTDDEIDLPYDLLPSQEDAQEGHYFSPKVLQDFARPYGFDVSNYQRFGLDFGTSWDSIVPFESMMWFANSFDEFDSENMFNSGLFDEEDIYDYIDLLNKHFRIDTSWLSFKSGANYDIDESVFDDMNKYIEDYYFGFLATMSQEMTKTIQQSPGLVDNVKLHRGGRLPINSENIGEYLGTTSTSYTKRIADLYTAMNSAVNHSTNVYAPEGTLGWYLSLNQIGNRRLHDGSQLNGVFNNQMEYAIGSGQPFIELPNESTGRYSGKALSSEADVLLLTPDQIQEVQGVVVDEVSSMLNSGRSNSNILNMSGIQAVNNLQSEQNLISTPITEGKYYDVLDYHEGSQGMVYDALQYLRKVQKKRTVSPTDLNKLIKEVNGEEAANEAEEWISGWLTDDVISHTKKGDKIKIAPLADKIARDNRFHKDFVKKQVYADVSPEQIFRIANKFPDTANTLLSYLQPFTDIDSVPKLENFKNRADFNERFVKIPYEYSWLLGQAEASDLYSSNHDFILDAESHRPTPTPEGAKRIFKNLGIDAFFMPPQTYKDANMRPSVENSYDRMIMGLAYGYLSDQPGAGGGHNAYNGITVGRAGTSIFGPLQTLNTLIHEFTHMGLDQYSRRDLPESDPLHLPDTAISNVGVPGLTQKTGYGEHYHAIMSEFETNWVATQVLGKFGLAEKADEGLSDTDKSLNRVGHFYDAVIGTNPGYEQYFQWEIYDEWIKVISDNIDMFINIGEEFDRKYSNLSAAEVSQKWDEVRQMVNAGRSSAEMPSSIFSNGYMDYLNEEKKKQEEAKKTTQGIANGYKEWYKEQIKEVKKLHELRTENERAQYGRIRYQQEQNQLEADGKRNAAENRRKLRERYEKQREPYEKERQKEKEEEEARKKEKEEKEKFFKDRRGSIKDSWDNKRKKIAESLGGGYYYFGGEKKQRDQNAAQKFLQKWAFAGADLAEKAETTLYDKSSTLRKSGQEYAKENGYNETLNKASDKMGNLMKVTEEFKGGLESLSEIFPVLTPAVFALNTALAIQEGVATALTFATEILTFSQTGETGSAFLQTMANWLVSESAVQAAIAETVLAGAIWTTNIAMKGIQLLFENPIILIAIAAIIAAIEAVKFWENQHAKALEETRKELEKNTAKNNIALSQYKDLKKARENETDAIKKQQAARKEAIALYELEAARIQRRKAIHDEAELRNDAVWGEYGLRASLQKMGLGFIAGGDFESQYENYDGTTKNIRQIKEATLGNLFATSEQRQVASFYDNNSMFLAEVEAYKEPLQELYDKESKLIEQYGSIDLARGSKEFEEAVQEFADATGVNGETAVKMLDWLETENRVDQASKVGQAEISRIMAERQAKLMEIQYGDQYTNTDFSDIGNAMLMAQFQEMMNTARTEIWWDLLFSYLDAILTGLNPLNWVNGELSKKMAIIGVNQQSLAELNEEGNNIYNDMLEAYENADRKDYGNSGASYDDAPFAWAIEASSTQYAVNKQGQEYLKNGHVMSDKEFLNTQSAHAEQYYGVTNEQLRQEKAKQDQELYEKAKEDILKKSETLSNENNTKVNYGNNVKPNKEKKENITQGNTIVIKNININTEDDPEKIKTAFMNLMIELEEQITPRQVSRVVGEAPSASTSLTADTDATNPDASTDPNDPNASTDSNNINQNNTNNNPTL